MAVLPWKLFLLFVFFLPLEFFSVKAGGRSLYWADPLFFLFLVSRLLTLRKERLRLPPKEIVLPLILMGASLILSTVFSTAPKRSIVSLGGKIMLLLYLFAGADMLRSRERVLTLLKTLFLSCSCVALSGLLGTVLFYAGSCWNPFIWSGYGQLAPGNYPRLTASFETPQELGLYCSMAPFLLLAFRQGTEENGWKKAVLPVFLLLIPSLLFCLSRDVIGVVTGTAGLVTLLRLIRKQFCWLASLLTWIFALGIFGLFFVSVLWFITPCGFKLHGNREVQSVSGMTCRFGDNSEEGRSGFTDYALIYVNLHHHDKVWYFRDMKRVLNEHPLTGAGVGIAEYRNNLWKIPRDMHNTYYQILVQQGWPGLAAFVLFFTVLCRIALRGKIQEQDAGLLTALLALLFAIPFVLWFNHHANNRILWLTFSLLLNVRTALKTRENRVY